LAVVSLLTVLTLPRRTTGKTPEISGVFGEVDRVEGIELGNAVSSADFRKKLREL